VVWQQDEILLLIKAANTYPPGSVERWTQVTKYVNEHSQSGSTKPKTEKDIIKEVRKLNFILAKKLPGNRNNAAMITKIDRAIKIANKNEIFLFSARNFINAFDQNKLRHSNNLTFFCNFRSFLLRVESAKLWICLAFALSGEIDLLV
jgi:hypothetical protein